MLRAVDPRHRLQAELVDPLLAQRQADQAAAVPGHEVDRVGRRHLRRNDQVALILPVVVVDQDEHPPVARLVDDRLGADQHLLHPAIEQLLEPHQRIGGRIPVGRAELAQGVGVKAGGAGKPAAASFAGIDQGGQLIDQGGGHVPRRYHTRM